MKWIRIQALNLGNWGKQKYIFLYFFMKFFPVLWPNLLPGWQFGEQRGHEHRWAHMGRSWAASSAWVEPTERGKSEQPDHHHQRRGRWDIARHAQLLRQTFIYLFICRRSVYIWSGKGAEQIVVTQEAACLFLSGLIQRGRATIQRAPLSYREQEVGQRPALTITD